MQQANRSSSVFECSVSSQCSFWAVQAALWSLWGNTPLTAVCSQLVLRIERSSHPFFHSPSTASPVSAALSNMALILSSLVSTYLRFFK